MMWHWNILYSSWFWWFTNYKGLVTLLWQKDLLGQQAQWMEKHSQFDFKVVYISGTGNHRKGRRAQISTTENLSITSGARRKAESISTWIQSASTHTTQDETQKLMIQILPWKNWMARIKEEFNKNIMHITCDADITVINNNNTNEEQILSLTKAL